MLLSSVAMEGHRIWRTFQRTEASIAPVADPTASLSRKVSRILQTDDDTSLFVPPSFQMRVFKMVIKFFPHIKHIKGANIYRVHIQQIVDR